MKYNPTNHSIEFDDGRLCCNLSEEVSTKKAYLYADNLGDAKELKDLERQYEELDRECAQLEEDNRNLADQVEDLEFDLECAERQLRDAKRRVNEPDELGWWWVINPKDNFNHHPIQIFKMNDELMVQFANQTIPLSLFKEEYDYLRDFYKAYLPEY